MNDPVDIIFLAIVRAAWQIEVWRLQLVLGIVIIKCHILRAFYSCRSFGYDIWLRLGTEKLKLQLKGPRRYIHELRRDAILHAIRKERSNGK